MSRLSESEKAIEICLPWVGPEGFGEGVDKMRRESARELLAALDALAEEERQRDYWRIVPRRAALDQFPRRFQHRKDAERLLGGMSAYLRRRYRVQRFNYTGKRIDMAPLTSYPQENAPATYRASRSAAPRKRSS